MTLPERKSDSVIDMEPQQQGSSEGSYHWHLDEALEQIQLEFAGVGKSHLDFDGPKNPRNPKNWSKLRRYYTMLSIAFNCLAVTLGTSIITLAIPEIQERFTVSREAALLSLSVFAYGLALGPMIAAPISEIFGRMMLIKGSMVVYVLFLVGAALAQNIGSLLIFRFLAGMAGSPALAIGAGVGADLFHNIAYAIPGALFTAAPFLGPAFGPVLGGFTAYYKDFRWTQWVSLFAATLTLLAVLPAPETHKNIILRKIAKRANHVISEPKLTTRGKLSLGAQVVLIRPIKMLFCEPIVLFLALYTSFPFSVMFSFFEAFPIIFSTVHGFNVWQVGLTFLGIVLGVTLATLTSTIVDAYLYKPKAKQAEREGSKIIDPEARLYCAMMGSIGITIGLFWFAWTAGRSVHWISPVLASVLFAWGSMCSFISTVLYMMDVYGALVGASAMAANGFLRYGMAGSFPLFTTQMYDKLGIPWATSLLAFLSLAFIPIPWVLFKYGPWLRQKSRFIRLASVSDLG